MKNLPYVHFTPAYLHVPTHPITVNLIGAGGTGSWMAAHLADLHFALLANDHPGLSLKLFDDDLITSANLRRQRFTDAEIGRAKSVQLINRINCWYGTNWKAVTSRFEMDEQGNTPPSAMSNIYVSCVDSGASRLAIAEILTNLSDQMEGDDRPYYWLDLGNSLNSGQSYLSTLCPITQPESKLLSTVAELPYVTDLFADLLKNSDDDYTPSCSLQQALNKQDLYINPTIAVLGASLIKKIITKPYIDQKGFYVDLEDLICHPVPLLSAP